MKLAVGSDERTTLTDHLLEDLKRRGHELMLSGAVAGKQTLWPDVGLEVAEAVADNRADQGILFCWTGTGVSIVANKIPGIRAALCTDSESARGARLWNDANVLVMGLRLTSPHVGEEILNAWFSTAQGSDEDARCVSRVAEIEKKYLRG